MVYRYGREEDEVISGLSFMKEMIIDRVQVYPEYEGDETTKFQVTSYLNSAKLDFIFFKRPWFALIVWNLDSEIQ